MQENRDPWRIRLVKPRIPWLTHPVLPADLGAELCAAMLDRASMLEDVSYQKVVPNQFVVEINPENYTRNFQPLGDHILQQWQIKLSECLSTANSRMGRKEYVFAGKLNVNLRPAENMLPHQARILSQIQPDSAARPTPTPSYFAALQPEPRPSTPLNACLEQLSSGKQWSLHPGMMTLGRLEACDIPLSLPEITIHRLISGQHAFLEVEGARVRLYDGSPSGKPSLNGTFVNRQRIFATGYELKDGDTVTLAAIDPSDPRPDTPGVVSFRFRTSCAGVRR